MITFGKTISKANYLFGKLPHYFKANDSYKDGNDEGLLERYLEIFCLELDEQVAPYIDELLDITNIEALSGLTSPNAQDLSNHIIQLFGNPPDIGTGEIYSGDEDNYIQLIRYIIHIFKHKGTFKGLSLFLALYGYEIDTQTETSAGTVTYDNDPIRLYDDDLTYDQGFLFFSSFSLVITDKPGMGTKNPTQAWLDDFLKPTIQNFLSPIWAELTTLTYTP